MWGIEAAKSFTDLQRTISNAIKRLLGRIEDLEAKMATDFQPQINQINTELDALEIKQDREKLVQIIAVQETEKTTMGDADIPASDAIGAALNNWVRRILNKSETNNTDYFEFDNSGVIFIKRAGKYLIEWEAHGRRTNYWASSVEYIPPSGTGPTIFKQVKGRTATGATATGNEEHISSMLILEVTESRAGGYIELRQWTETNTSNERYGLWFCRGSAGAPYNTIQTCSLKITLISES